MTQFITVTEKLSPNTATFSFNPAEVVYYNFSAHDKDHTYSRMEITFSNGKTVVVIGKATLVIYHHLCSRPKESILSVESIEFKKF